MKEIAFIVKRDSEFYNQYFAAKAEKQRFHDLARAFFEKHSLLDSARYYQSEFLGLELNDEQKQRFEGQLRKNDDKDGMSIFKKNSIMQKSWNEEVTSNINFDIINKIGFWYLGFIMCGKYSLWDYDGNIYGCLKDGMDGNINLADYMTEIKMSEYYSAIESADA